MSVTVNIAGGLQSIAIGKPSTTSKAAIYTVEQRTSVVCLSLRATNSSGSGITLQLHFYDSSANSGAGREVEIYPSTSLSTATTNLIDLGELVLDPNDELRATVGTADALDLVFTYALRRGGM